jgi:DNA-binding response OmpR family regulator
MLLSGDGEFLLSSSTHDENTMPRYVLIIDDEPNIITSLEFLMKKEGYEVCVAEDGEEALRTIEQHPPDLVLLDVMMPNLDGFGLLEKIRSNSTLKDVRVILLTAKGRDVEREKGLALGADEYITKPFSTRELTRTVQQLLERAAD